MKTATRFCVPLTVYYDRSCPLCEAEMHALRALDWRGRLRLEDCSAAGFDERACAAEGVTREAMMGRLHARDPEGRWLRGLDAFEAVYAAAGRERLARLWGSRRLRPLLDRVYPFVARHRQALSRLGLHRVVAWLLRPRGGWTRN